MYWRRRRGESQTAQQAGAEQHHHQRHRADKPWVLKLNAPAQRLIPRRSRVIINASARKDATMPQTGPELPAYGCAFARPVCTSEPSFMASTGRTQGITLRISPPVRAISNTHHKAGACAETFANDRRALLRQTAVGRTSDRRLPLRSGAASPQLSVTGICATSVSPVSEKVVCRNRHSPRCR